MILFGLFDFHLASLSLCHSSTNCTCPHFGLAGGRTSMCFLVQLLGTVILVCARLANKLCWLLCGLKIIKAGVNGNDFSVLVHGISSPEAGDKRPHPVTYFSCVSSKTCQLNFH